ncbi:TetR/AcrR family transcriptional regulator [Bacillus sp. FSL K6-3431]|uniref:TetR/AcrR family transcriptional regulator n=1 Tax=Bacillus sp. FSL K6-3431 TaxID=2921500 RepID=UPI0030F9F50C
MNQRGRRRGANGEQSRALLLTIAADEFAEQGYYLTKISTIVEKADLTQPAFYLYFESKAAIFQELVEEFRFKLLDFTKRSRLENGIQVDSLSKRIAQRLAAIFRFLNENPNLTRIGFMMAKESMDIKKQLAAQIEGNLLSEQQAGYFEPNIDMSTFAESLVGIIERLTIKKLFTGIMTPEELANEIVHIFLYGVLAKEHR